MSYQPSVSRCEFQPLPSDEAKLVWLIPCGGPLSLFAIVAKQSIGPASQIADALPFLAFLYFANKIGQELLQVLQIGAYLTFICAAALFVLPHCLTKRKA